MQVIVVLPISTNKKRIKQISQGLWCQKSYENKYTWPRPAYLKSTVQKLKFFYTLTNFNSNPLWSFGGLYRWKDSEININSKWKAAEKRTKNIYNQKLTSSAM